jgi:hypothetical protein
MLRPHAHKRSQGGAHGQATLNPKGRYPKGLERGIHTAKAVRNIPFNLVGPRSQSYHTLSCLLGSVSRITPRLKLRFGYVNRQVKDSPENTPPNRLYRNVTASYRLIAISPYRHIVTSLHCHIAVST